MGCVDAEDCAAEDGEDCAGTMAGEVAARARAAKRAKAGMALVPFGLVSTSIRVRQGSGFGGDSGTSGVKDRRGNSPLGQSPFNNADRVC